MTDGLVLALDAADRNSYVSGSTVWNDMSGNGYNGVLTNGPSFSSGSGGSIVFDGVDDYVETGNSILTSNASYTMCAWAKSSTNNTYANRLMGNADSLTGISGTDIIWNPVSLGIYVVRRDGGADKDMTSPAISLNIATGWHHVIVTYDHTGVGSILYVDGVQVANNTNLGFTCSLPFRIGRDGNGSDAFNGSVSNVQLYNRALSLSEVLQNYNAQKSRFGLK